MISALLIMVGPVRTAGSQWRPAPQSGRHSTCSVPLLCMSAELLPNLSPSQQHSNADRRLKCEQIQTQHSLIFVQPQHEVLRSIYVYISAFCFTPLTGLFYPNGVGGQR